MLIALRSDCSRSTAAVVCILNASTSLFIQQTTPFLFFLFSLVCPRPKEQDEPRGFARRRVGHLHGVRCGDFGSFAKGSVGVCVRVGSVRPTGCWDARVNLVKLAKVHEGNLRVTQLVRRSGGGSNAGSAPPINATAGHIWIRKVATWTWRANVYRYSMTWHWWRARCSTSLSGPAEWTMLATSYTSL